MQLLLAFIIAMAVTMGLIPLLMRWAGAMRVLDAPAERKVHSAPMPRVGGIAMVAGVLVALAVWLPRDDPRLLAYLAGAATIFAFGVWDDRDDLPPLMKLLGQCIGVMIVVAFGNIQIEAVTLVERHTLPAWLGMPLTVLFILGVTNAINLSDGLDGLAGGTTLLAAAAIFLLARSCGDHGVEIVALSLSGALLGFLRFNTWPARIFMGDGGSQFLGFTLAVLAVLLMQREGQALSTAVPLMFLGLPVVDTLMVMSRRIREGRSPFSADRDHLHHKLLGLGFDHHEAVVVIYSVQGAFFLCGWFLRYESDPVIVATFIAMSLSIVTVLIVAGRSGWRWRSDQRALPREAVRFSALRRGLLWLRRPENVPRWALRLSVAATLLYIFGVSMLEHAAPTDVAWLAVGVAAGLCFTLLMSLRSRFSSAWGSRALLYTAAALVVYLDHVSRDAVHGLAIIKYVALPLLAVTVLIRMRLSRERRFELTTLDVLLIFIALAIPNLPGLVAGPSNLGISILKLVVLVYAVELCTDQSERGRLVLAVGVAGCACVIGLRGLVV
jgi:UDP-GlcNAc:undecaprenyl-phosphate/decaprenyl-phosphate GlcNAc-1-phosphate transferase